MFSFSPLIKWPLYFLFISELVVSTSGETILFNFFFKISNNTVQARPTTDPNTDSSIIHEVSQRLDTCLLVSPGTRSAADFIRSSPAVSINSGRSEGNTSRRSGVSASGSDAQLSDPQESLPGGAGTERWKAANTICLDRCRAYWKGHKQGRLAIPIPAKSCDTLGIKN